MQHKTDHKSTNFPHGISRKSKTREGQSRNLDKQMGEKEGKVIQETLTGVSISEGVHVNRRIERVKHIESNNNVHGTNNQSCPLVRTISSRHLQLPLSR